MPELTSSQRMMGELFCRKLNRCVEEGISFWDALHDKTVRRPWAKGRKEEQGGAAAPAPKSKPAPFQTGDRVIVQLPQPDGSFKTMNGVVAEDQRPGEGCVRVCTGEGEAAKLGTFNSSCVYLTETAFLC